MDSKDHFRLFKSRLTVFHLMKKAFDRLLYVNLGTFMRCLLGILTKCKGLSFFGEEALSFPFVREDG